MKSIFKILKSRCILLMVLVFFLLATGAMYHQQALSFHFVDEEDNFVVGNYILRGERLYQDIFSHHQPFTYLLSATIQKVTRPNSLFLLVKRHREVIIVWSALWSFLLVFRFGVAAFLTVIIFELSKIYLLGNLFLAEGLAVYPLMYIVGSVLKNDKNSLKAFELFFIGICISVLGFLLATLWPLLLILFLILLLNHFKLRKELFFLLLGIVSLAVIILASFSFQDYLNDTVFINQKYYIPYAVNLFGEGFSVKSFLTPLISFLPTVNSTATLVIIRVLSLLLFSSLIFMIFKKNFYQVALIILLLGLANIRYISPGSQEYAGFHLLPWFGLLVFTASLTSFNLIRDKKTGWPRLVMVSLLLVVLITSGKYGRERLFIMRDIEKDYYVNYSQQFSFGEAVRIMKKPKEKLFVAPDEMLIYWQADINHAARFTYYYPWMTKVPEFKSEVDNMFLNNPPTFWYFKNYKDELGLADNLSNYHRMKKDGSDTDLYILSEKKEDLTKEQRDRLSFYGFEID